MRWRRFLIVWGAASAVALTIAYVPRALGAPWLIIWEQGSSMPRGVYVLDHLPPAKMGEVIVLDDAPDWGRPYLMKRVAGRNGMRFCWSPDRQQHRLGARWMPGPSVQALALEIPIWTGCRRLADDEVVGYGGHPDSYDSRYIGPIRQADIAGVYRLVLPL